MIRFTVVWDEEAIDELADLWLEAGDRESVTRSSHSVDLILAVDPMVKGSELKEGLRRLECGQFHVLFSVSHGDQIVEVHSVKRTRPST